MAGIFVVGNPAVAGGHKTCCYPHQVLAVSWTATESCQLCIWLLTGNSINAPVCRPFVPALDYASTVLASLFVTSPCLQFNFHRAVSFAFDYLQVSLSCTPVYLLLWLDVLSQVIASSRTPTERTVTLAFDYSQVTRSHATKMAIFLVNLFTVVPFRFLPPFIPEGIAGLVNLEKVTVYNDLGSGIAKIWCERGHWGSLTTVTEYTTLDRQPSYLEELKVNWNKNPSCRW